MVLAHVQTTGKMQNVQDLVVLPKPQMNVLEMVFVWLEVESVTVTLDGQMKKQAVVILIVLVNRIVMAEVIVTQVTNHQYVLIVILDGQALLVMIPVSMVTKMAAFVYVIQHVTMELDVILSAPAMEYAMINLNVFAILLLDGVAHIVKYQDVHDIQGQTLNAVDMVIVTVKIIRVAVLLVGWE